MYLVDSIGTKLTCFREREYMKKQKIPGSPLGLGTFLTLKGPLIAATHWQI